MGVNNMTVYGDVTFTSGKSGKAFTCSGVSGSRTTNAYATYPPGVSNSGPWTYEFWIKRDSSASDAWIFDRDYQGPNSSGGGNPLVELHTDASGNATWLIRNDAGSSMSITGFTIPASVWHHLAVTRSGATFTAYVDAVSVGTTSLAGALTPDPPRVCGFVGGANQGMTGQFDSVRIWNRALSTSELSAIATGDGSCSATTIKPPPTVPASGLLARWELNDGTGTAAADSSGNSRNASLQNASWQTSNCKFASCAQFSGTGGVSGSYLTYASSIPTSGSGASFAAWVQLDAGGTGTYQTIINSPWSSCCTVRLLVDPSLHPYWDAGQSTDENPTGYTFPLGQWIHVVWTIAAGGNATLYVNAVNVAQTAAGVPGVFPNMTNTDVGAADSFQWPAKGLFNDVLIYNRVLSPAEVTSLYQLY